MRQAKLETQRLALARSFLEERFHWQFANSFLLDVFLEAVFGNNFLYLQPHGGSTIDRHGSAEFVQLTAQLRPVPQSPVSALNLFARRGEFVLGSEVLPSTTAQSHSNETGLAFGEWPIGVIHPDAATKCPVYLLLKPGWSPFCSIGVNSRTPQSRPIVMEYSRFVGEIGS